METTLVNESNHECYVDEVAIHSETKESHIKHLEKFFAFLLTMGFVSNWRSAHSFKLVWNS